jgi:hypothetical protein
MQMDKPDDAALVAGLREIVEEAAFDINDGLGPGGYVVHANDQSGQYIAHAADRIEQLVSERDAAFAAGLKRAAKICAAKQKTWLRTGGEVSPATCAAAIFAAIEAAK